MWWSVTVKVVGPADEDAVDSDDVGDLVAALADYSAAGGGEGHVYDVTVSVEADDLTAARAAAEAVQRGAGEVGLPDWPIVRLEAMTDDEVSADLAEPLVPPLVGVSEIAEALGVTRQRAWSLATKHKDFPDPVLQVSAGPLWLASAVEAFERRWTRQPGRPRQDMTA